MKKYLLPILFVLTIAITPASAVFASPVSVDRLTDHIEPLVKTDYIQADHFSATSSSATSTLKKTSITGAVSILGEYFTNFTTYVRSLFSNGTGLNYSAGAFSLANTAVTPGSYTNSNLTIDQQGRITAASSGSAGSGSSGLASSTAGNGWTAGNVAIVSSNSAVYGQSTSTPSLASEFTYGGTLGSFVGGSSGSLSLTANGIALTKLATVAANTVLGNKTGSTGNVTAFATSTLGIALSDTTGVLGETRGGTNQSTYTAGDTLYASGSNTLAKLAIGTNGKILAVSGGLPAWVSTTTAGTGLTYNVGAPGNFSVNASQNISTLSNLTGNGFVITSGGTGALSIDTTAYVPTSRTISTTYPLGGGGALSGNLTLTTAFGTTTANTFSALNIFNAGATSTQITISDKLWLTSLGTPAGAFLAVDANGKVIATSTPAPAPGGSNQQVQFNDSGTLAGAVGFVWDKVNSFLGIGSTTPHFQLAVDAPATQATSTLFAYRSPRFEFTTAMGTTTVILTAGGTWTAPANLNIAMVEVIGGAGAGGGGYDAGNGANVCAGNGGNGSASTFVYNSGGSTLTANGGNGGGGICRSGSLVAGTGGTGGTASGGTTNTTGTSGTNGNTGGGSVNGGGNGFSATGNGTLPGGGGKGNSNGSTGAGGGGGGYSLRWITGAQMGASATVTIGAGGGSGGNVSFTGGAATNGGNASGSTGGTAGTGPGGPGEAGGNAGSASSGSMTGGGGAEIVIHYSQTVPTVTNTFGNYIPSLISGWLISSTTIDVPTNYVWSTTTPAVAMGTSTPDAQLTIQSFWGNPAFTIYSFVEGTVNYLIWSIDRYAHIITGGPAPTCGTGCVSITGDDKNFRMITGSGVGSATVNFAKTWTNRAGTPITPVCTASEESAGIVATNASSTPTTTVLEFGSSLTTKIVGGHCEASTNFTY